MVLYSSFHKDLSFQENKTKNPMIGCRDICKINTAPFFLKHPVFPVLKINFKLLEKNVKHLVKEAF